MTFNNGPLTFNISNTTNRNCVSFTLVV
jgi:hypothetical protein